MDKKVIGAIVALTVILGAGFWYITSYKSMSTSNITQEQQVSKPTNEQPAENNSTVSGQQLNIQEFTVTGSKYKFDPDQIKVKKGETVKITFKNSDGMHDFVIDEFKTRTKVIKSGEQETIQFTADKAGSFEYYCSVGNHRAMGMKGNLVVE